MPLFDSIDTNQKKQILQAIYMSMERELYESLLRLGIEPDTYVLGDHSVIDGLPDSWVKTRVLEMDVTLSTTKGKIDSLEG